ncbi:MAG: hypothetical protein QOG70_2706 [Solirubrobacteraceae bacterium]|jgi:hypothetical protein|nr:hypothetical protein [Solirubrobacteraceae bacterium]
MAAETPSADSLAPSERWLTRRRAGRQRRREIREAVRGEWELEPRARGWAAVRAFAKQVADLEQARLVAHAEAARRPPIPRPGKSQPGVGAADTASAPPRARRA